MGKKKDVNGFKYRKQGSIDDENFLMLAHGIGTVKESVENSKTDLSDTNEKLDDIKTAITNQSSDVNIDLSDTNEKLDDIKTAIENESFNIDLSDTNEKLDDIKTAITNQSVDLSETNTNLTDINTQLDKINSTISEKEMSVDIEQNVDLSGVVNGLSTLNNTLDGYLSGMNVQFKAIDNSMENLETTLDNFDDDYSVIKEKINSILSVLKNSFIEITTIDSGSSYTIASGAHETINISGTINGTIGGIVGFRTTSSSALAYRVQYIGTDRTGHNFVMAVYNRASSSVTITPEIDVLSLRTDNFPASIN